MKRALGVVFVLTLAVSLSFAQTQSTTGTQTSQASDDIQFTRQPSVNAGDHSAEISWETNNRAATFVKYGTDKNNLDKESRHSGGARDHRVVLAELQPNTTYYYQILTQDGQVRHEGQFTTKGGSASASSGQTSTSGQSGTQTGALNDDVRIVEGPTAGMASANSVDLKWRTNNVAATDVKYGTDPNNMDQRAYTPGGSRDHTARLDNLQPNTTYHFAILTNDGVVRHQGSFLFQPNQQAQVQSQPVTVSGQTTTSGQQSGGFLGAVKGQQQGNVQIVGGPAVEQVSDTTATIVWKTNMAASTSFRYGKDPKMMIHPGSGAWGDRHSAQISQLEPNTLYYIEVESATQQGTGNAAKQMFTFRTLPPGSQARTNSVPF